MATIVVASACGIDAAPKVRKAKAVEPVKPTTLAAVPADPQAEPVAEPTAKPTAEPNKQYPDPPWYRTTLFSDAQGKVVSTSRSEADEQGRFKSHIVFELNALTADECIRHLSAAAKPSVPNLERSEEADGRFQLAGSTDRYNATMLCGEAKGTMRAYVAYEWTK